MSSATVIEQLSTYGPAVDRAGSTPSLVEARKYCRRLAETHYENFTVASWLLPVALRPHFHAIYAYCRWADDLADETGDPELSLQLLDWWESELTDCYAGRVSHPVFVALWSTISEYRIPIEPFRDLLTAFRQDQYRNRYQTFNELLEYCRNSANPVGRLVLYLGRCVNEETLRLSDSICTGLQLANFWQDVARDWDRGRVYLPLDDCQTAGYSSAMFERREYNANFRELLSAEVARTEAMLRSGEPLVRLVPAELSIDIALFIRGGLAICEAIRRQNYDVWSKRPTVGKLAKVRLLAGAWWQSRGSARVDQQTSAASQLSAAHQVESQQYASCRDEEQR